MLRRKNTGSILRSLEWLTRSRKVSIRNSFISVSVLAIATFAVLVGLYEEPDRPPNAVDYMRKYMGAAAGVDVDALKAENERLRAQVSELQAALDEANSKVRGMPECARMLHLMYCFTDGCCKCRMI
jgi:hypothetical protein